MSDFEPQPEDKRDVSTIQREVRGMSTEDLEFRKQWLTHLSDDLDEEISTAGIFREYSEIVNELEERQRNSE